MLITPFLLNYIWGVALTSESLKTTETQRAQRLFCPFLRVLRVSVVKKSEINTEIILSVSSCSPCLCGEII